MSLRDVKSNVIDQLYETFEEVFADLNLVWFNCIQYNYSDAIVTAAYKFDAKCRGLLSNYLERNVPNYEDVIIPPLPSLAHQRPR